jgi:endonuclease/exonuclease/phosphatase family metal-dependent hydrolase
MITVATYNIRKAIGTDRLRRPDRILHVLNEVGADIVALQEADRRFGARASAIPIDLLSKETDYVPVPFESRRDSIGWHGNAILVKRHIDILSHKILTIPTLEPRGAVLADLAIGVQRLRVVGMHLDLSGLWRRRQAHSILQQLQAMDGDVPEILMGDLNEWTAHRGCLHDFSRAHRIAHSAPSFHSQRPIARLDRIMASQDIELVDSGTHHSILARRASDHLPVWANIAFR